MKASIRPEYKQVKVSCSCGHSFTTGSAINRDFHIEICDKCHPFYTGQQRIVDTGGRVERFRQKYAAKKNSKNEAATNK